MKGIRFAQNCNIVPLLMTESTAGERSKYVKVNGASWITFLVGWGDADTAIILTVEASSVGSSNASEEAIPFIYRLSGAASAGSDTWGDATSATSTGVTLTATTDTGKVVLIEVDPRTISSGQNYLSVQTTATTYNMTGTPAVAIVAFVESPYSQKDPLSTT